MVSACGWNSASASSVMFATLCSNPAPIKANRHQNTITSLATSLVVRNEHQTARHTSQLARMPRANATTNGRFIFVSAVASTNDRCGSLANEVEAASSAANAIEPTRLPTSDQPHKRASPAHVVRPAKRPSGSTIALPVNNSAPATTTRLSAIPKDAPITTLVKGELL